MHLSPRLISPHFSAGLCWLLCETRLCLSQRYSLSLVPSSRPERDLAADVPRQQATSPVGRRVAEAANAAGVALAGISVARPSARVSKKRCGRDLWRIAVLCAPSRWGVWTDFWLFAGRVLVSACVAYGWNMAADGFGLLVGHSANGLSSCVLLALFYSSSTWCGMEPRLVVGFFVPYQDGNAHATRCTLHACNITPYPGLNCACIHTFV